MIVELHYINLPEDLVLGSVFNGDWKVTTVIETSEFAVKDWTGLACTGNWCLNNWLWFGLVKREWLTTNTLTLLKSSLGICSNTNFSFFDWGNTHGLLAIEILHNILVEITKY